MAEPVAERAAAGVVWVFGVKRIIKVKCDDVA